MTCLWKHVPRSLKKLLYRSMACVNGKSRVLNAVRAGCRRSSEGGVSFVCNTVVEVMVTSIIRGRGKGKSPGNLGWMLTDFNVSLENCKEMDSEWVIQYSESWAVLWWKYSMMEVLVGRVRTVRAFDSAKH